MRVVITGIGMVNALGNTSNTVFNNLLSKVSGISQLPVDSLITIGGKPSFDKSQ